MEHNSPKVEVKAYCNKGVLGGITGTFTKCEIDKSTINIAKIKVERCEGFYGKGTCDCPLKELSEGRIPS